MVTYTAGAPKEFQRNECVGWGLGAYLESWMGRPQLGGREYAHIHSPIQIPEWMAEPVIVKVAHRFGTEKRMIHRWWAQLNDQLQSSFFFVIMYLRLLVFHACR